MNSIQYRYQVGTGTGTATECVDEHATRAAAEASVQRLLKQSPGEEVWMFDRHARFGAIEEWRWSHSAQTQRRARS